jgi:hypothetical protein
LLGQADPTRTVEKFVPIEMHLLERDIAAQTGQRGPNRLLDQAQGRIDEIQIEFATVEKHPAAVQMVEDLIGVLDRRDGAVPPRAVLYYRFADWTYTTWHCGFKLVRSDPEIRRYATDKKRKQNYSSSLRGQQSDRTQDTHPESHADRVLI